jgi:hypothetical protein
MQPKDMKKAEKDAQERASRERSIANQWREFAKTAAYKDLVEYMETNQAMLLEYAQEMVMPSPVAEGQQLIIDEKKAFSLLQNRRGIDIVRTYVDGYVKSTT